MKNLWYRLFPRWKVVHTGTGEWNIKVSTDLFGNYKETKYCYFELLYSARLNRYKSTASGYHARDHVMYTNYKNEAIRLNSESDKSSI